MTPFWFSPKHQPREGQPVRFHLRPLSKTERYDLQVSIHANGGIPSSECATRLLLSNVIGWEGIGDPPVEFSRSAIRAAAIDGEATPEDVDWMIWTGEIAGHLYSRSLLGPAEKKD